MKKENRTVLKDIMQNRDLEINIPAYGNAYINATYEYSLIRLVLNYYTMKEVEDELGAGLDDYLSCVLNEIHTILFEALLSEDVKADYSDIVDRVDRLRDEMTKKMTLLTSYTDTLQIYEYVLNRLEYGITGEKVEVEESALAAKVFQYLFSDNDKMVVNSKIQMVTGQLPIRMTKNRFFDYLTDTLNIYNGSDKSSVDDFVAMLKSTALLELPKGYGEEYKEIAQVIEILEKTDYKALDLEKYNELMEQFSMTATHLSGLVSNYLLVMEIVNNLYAAMLAKPFENNEGESVLACVNMLKGLHDAFVSAGGIPEAVDDGFMVIEGRQEELGEDIMQYESILPDVLDGQADTISWMMADAVFSNLDKISKLLSSSLFIDLEKTETVLGVADSEYITSVRDELVGLLTVFFEKHPREINRAVMAALFSNMPVLFNSQQEVKDYIEYSLNHCNSSSELMACASILEEMMAED
ncbi:MAG: hypothetical protein PUC12_05150 [Clostridiales bacterium]|nr:hypothetical protein [Clostridiales bacterium]